MAANASVAVARLGGDAHYWGRVGADALGDRILAELAADGVDVGVGAADRGLRLSVRRHPGRRPRRAPGLRLQRSRPRRRPSWLPLERLAQCQAVLADVRWPEGAAAVFARGRPHGVLDRLRRRCRAARGAARSGPARDLRRVFAARVGACDRVRSPGAGPGRDRRLRPAGSSASRWAPTAFFGARAAASAGPAPPR